MNILEYSDIDYSKVKRQYEKVIGYLKNDDFRSADVKKFVEHDLYCARLDDTNRLLFKLVKYQNMHYGLMLEVVLNHAYNKSKFLRGAKVDESKIPVVKDISEINKEQLPSLIYVNQSEKRFHFLDKIISFDPDQNEVYRTQPPLMIIGPAGSGKTALTLEKMKSFYGQGIYVTLSPYLSDNARKLYFSNNYENEDQDVSFLSFKEYLETLRVPKGREIQYSVFVGWLNRFPKNLRVSDANKLFEEFRGVITGSVVDKPYLSKEEYLNLGVRQSIYLSNERELVYGLFEKYINFLKENGYYDPNILAYEYLQYVKPIYDFVFVDEVQDITNTQLRLILKGLKNPDNFILCGDSNQIVHPNFFTWSGLKSMLYKSDDLDTKKITRLLQSNFRNSRAITIISNLLIKIKQKRFGSIDRESSYLMNSVSEDKGEVLFLKDTDKIKNELNKNIRRSTRFALIVMRDEDKAEARRFFDTPLLFSIYEAKGLEYENVVLLNFISKERQNFKDIVNGITEEDLQEELRYMRASDKTDKSLEVYKFYINSLYVAFTRAVKRLFIIENDTQHPLLSLIGLKNPLETLQLKIEQSSKEDWQAEALRLQLQGKQEQADEIRRTILKTQPVPWEVYNQDRLNAFVEQILTAKDNPQKPRKALFDYALFYDSKMMIQFLSEANFDKAKQISGIANNKPFFNKNLYLQQQTNLDNKYIQKYSTTYYKEVLRQCELYGVDHRTEFNATPLMMSARFGNVNLAKELLNLGADRTLTDNFGWTAWHMALYRFLFNSKLSDSVFSQLHDLTAPTSISLKVDDRLIKIDSKSGEFMLFHVFMLLTYHRYNWISFDFFMISAVLLADEFNKLPDTTVPEYRKKRQYISSLLSKNEVDLEGQNSKKLFKRLRRGWYIFNPSIEIRHKDEWVGIYTYMGLDFLSTMPKYNTTHQSNFIYDTIALFMEEKEIDEREKKEEDLPKEDLTKEDLPEEKLPEETKVETRDDDSSTTNTKEQKTTLNRGQEKYLKLPKLDF